MDRKIHIAAATTVGIGVFLNWYMRTAEDDIVDDINTKFSKFCNDEEKRTMEITWRTGKGSTKAAKERRLWHILSEKWKFEHVTHSPTASDLVILRISKDPSAKWLWRYKYKYTNDWVSDKKELWEVWLQSFIGKPCRCLEIGCYEGLATCWLLDHVLLHEDSRITTVDTFCGVGQRPVKETTAMVSSTTRAMFEDNIYTSGAEHKVNVVGSTSLEFYATNILADSIASDGKFDIIYIDGSHIASDVMLDAVSCWNLLKPGGIMIFDDYNWCTDGGLILDNINTPRPAIDAFLKFFKEHIEVVNTEPLQHAKQVAIRKLRSTLNIN